MLNKVSIFLTDLYIYRGVLKQLVGQQLILRYRRTLLGYLWTLINPILMILVMSLVFSNLFKTDLKIFAIILFAGMIPWIFFSSVVTQSATSLIHNEGLIKKIYLPKAIFPLSIAFSLLIDSLLSFLALFAIILALGGKLSWSMLFLPISFILLFFFATGLGLIMSIATVFFRDLQHVILIAIQGLFFLTPILYKQDELVGKIVWLMKLNPITPFISLFRVPLNDSSLPSADLLIQSISITFITASLGIYVFIHQEKKIVFRL
jgi:ABC-type polysaccharide/polyol phosphate export permease